MSATVAHKCSKQNRSMIMGGAGERAWVTEAHRRPKKGLLPKGPRRLEGVGNQSACESANAMATAENLRIRISMGPGGGNAKRQGGEAKIGPKRSPTIAVGAAWPNMSDQIAGAPPRARCPKFWNALGCVRGLSLATVAVQVDENTCKKHCMIGSANGACKTMCRTPEKTQIIEGGLGAHEETVCAFLKSWWVLLVGKRSLGVPEAGVIHGVAVAVPVRAWNCCDRQPERGRWGVVKIALAFPADQQTADVQENSHRCLARAPSDKDARPKRVTPRPRNEGTTESEHYSQAARSQQNCSHNVEALPAKRVAGGKRWTFQWAFCADMFSARCRRENVNSLKARS